MPYEDCCGFFVPKHPETKAKLDIIKECEKEIEFDLNQICESVIKEGVTVWIKNQSGDSKWNLYHGM